MEIEFNASRAPSLPPTPVAPRGSQPAAGSDEPRFKGTEALAQALARLPDTRSEAVEKAQKLAGLVKYPPDEIIHRIATLLAIHLSPPSK
jgi:hypothetical protein